MRYIIVLVILFSFCSTARIDQNPNQEDLGEVWNKHLADFDNFYDSVKTLVRSTNQNHNFEKLSFEIQAARLAYKKIEFLFDYFSTEFNYLYINGPPLPKLHKESFEIDIIEPNGLQTLDELTTADDTIAAKVQISSIANDLLTSLELIEDSYRQKTIQPIHIIESIKSGIVRVFSLGLTGFDTPGTSDPINESKNSLNAMFETLKHLDSIKNVKSEDFIHLSKLFQDAQQNLEVSEFESLNRLKYLMAFINPIYKKLSDYQNTLGIENTQFKNHAQDYSSDNLFEEGFLNTDYYSQFAYFPFNNPKSIRLGKLLFNDPVLSKSLDMSCASCHHASKAFTDNQQFSNTNKREHFTKRNSPTLIDAGFSSKFFWDLRETDLERQVGHVISDSLEFNQSFKSIAIRLNQSKTYRELFRDIYKGIAKEDINSRSISNAIAAYVNSLKSFNSPFDQFVRQESNKLTKSSINGFNLFMGKANCGTCHFAPVFNGSVPPFYTDAESEVLGVTQSLDTLNPLLDIDLGRYANGISGDNHPHFTRSFKTVTVRNSELTFPYMHNGSLKSLEELMLFYNKGGGSGLGIDVPHQTLSPDHLELNKEEISDIIAFLNSLTDTTGLTSQDFDLPDFENQPYWNNRNKKPVYD